MDIVQCYPHIMRKVVKGEYFPKTWSHFADCKSHVRDIHLAHSPQMARLIANEAGKLWDKWTASGTKHTRTFWNAYCVEPWFNWSIGHCDVPLSGPNQNTQEAWHKVLTKTRIPGLFNGSTETVFAEGLPQLVELDGILLPSELCYEADIY